MSLSFIRCNFGRILYQLINDELILMKYKPTRLQEVQMVSIGYMLLHYMHDSRYLISIHNEDEPTQVFY